MSKKVLLLAVAILFGGQAGLAMAAGHPDNGPGCGLGKELWKEYPNAKTKGAQILIATTNGSFGSQTFGMSTGTLGCQTDDKWWAEQKVTMFAELNSDALAQEMAQGHGEHLTSMATLMGVPQQHHAVFFGMAQAQYTSLAQAGDLSASAMVRVLNEGIAAEPILAKVALN